MSGNNGKIWLQKAVKPYRASVVALSIASVVATGLSVAFAYLTKYLVNHAAKGENGETIFFAAVLFGLVVLKIVLQAFLRYYTEKTRTEIYTGLRSRLFERVLKADYAAIKNYHSGELISRITQDSAEVASDTVGIMPAAFGMATQLIGSLAVLFVIDWLFSLILIAGGMIIVAVTAVCRNKLKKYQKEIMAKDAEDRSFMQESVAAEVTIKAYGAEDKTLGSSKEILRAYSGRRLQRARFNSGVGLVYSLISNSGMLFAIVWCAVKAFGASADYGAVLSVVLLMEQLQRPFTSFSAVMPVYYSRLASAERLCEIDEIGQENICGGTCRTFEKIIAKDLCFSYDSECVIRDLSLEITRGETIVFEGASGAGKSTFFKLLLGIYKPQNGEINIETSSGRIKADENTRNLFAYVPQGNFLLSGTIRQNLAFFSDEEGEKLEKTLVSALKTACADFVFDLPEGLDTMLGERGAGLSEGQLQRLSVARAIASGRPVLLLDEATSALDEETEKNMLANIKKREDLTCLIISHRPAARTIADKTVIIEKI